MMRRAHQQILIALIVGFAVSGAAFGQNFGRVTVVVTDQDGKPIEGAMVTATCDEISRFREEKATNKKGKATITMADATKIYNFRVEHPDYPPVDMPVKPELRGSILREVTLSKTAAGGGSQTDGSVVQTVVYTPAERVYNEGVVMLKGGDTAGAMVKFQEALEKDPGMLQAHEVIAKVHVSEGEFEAALAAVDRMLALDPNSGSAYFSRYEALKGLGRDDEAEAALKKLTALSPGGDTTALIYNEGVAAVKRGDFESAKARFLEALGMNPDLKPAMTALAIIHVQEGKYQEAVDMAEKVLALDPEDTQAMRVRWDGYRALGNAAKAQEAMDVLAANDPAPLIKEFYDQGVELFNNGDTAGAVAQFEAVIGLAPDHAEAHYRLGVALAASDAGKAREHIEEFIELAPDHPEVAVAKDMLQYLK